MRGWLAFAALYLCAPNGWGQASSSNLNAAFNPAIGMAIDMAAEKQDSKADFLFRAAELNVESYVDPFLKGAAVITGTDGNTPTTTGGTPTVDVEEAWLETTSLPWNLRVTGGRVFASFGRLEHFHDHELPVVDRPNSIDTYIGGESRADGLEVNFLFPTDTFIEAVAGAYDKIGETNDRVDLSTDRTLAEFTYLGRLHTYFDLGDNHSLDLGVSDAWTPERAEAEAAGGGLSPRAGSYRQLTGVDVTYRYHPVSGGLYRGVLWGTEVLRNDELILDSENVPAGRQVGYAGFSFLEVKAGRRLRPGVMVDLTQEPSDPNQLTSTYTGYLSFDVSEFQRVRVEYSRIERKSGPGSDLIALQWTGVFGHHVHGFRDR